MKREIVVIDENKCIGCGKCIPNCHEGALQIIDGKARLISDLYCDGLGACIGHCPVHAMTIVTKDVEPYDEKKVMIDNIIPAGTNTIIAHLSHLKDHNATEFYNEAIKTLNELNIKNPLEDKLLNQNNDQHHKKHHNESEHKHKHHDNSEHKHHHHHQTSGCPGSRAVSFEKNESSSTGNVDSQLRQWPVQLHLVSPQAPYYKNSDLLLAADCTAYAVGNFHSGYLKDKSLAIACPKLDDGLDIYAEKITALIDLGNINTLTCMIMEVPCCGGLLQIAKKGVAQAKRKIPLKLIVVSIKGEILREEWV